MTKYLDGLDDKDRDLAQQALLKRDAIPGPRLGDYVRFPCGRVERFSHDWGDTFQTSPGGAFYLSGDSLSLSCGGLNPATPKAALYPLNIEIPGSCWFFHHGRSGAGRGVYFNVPCRVFQTDARYDGFLGDDFIVQSTREAQSAINQMLQDTPT